jgi:glutathione S-transferase
MAHRQPPGRELTFYRLPVSNCCSGVLAALVYKDLEFRDREPPGRHRAPTGAWRPGYGTAEYKRIVPSGTIPALAVGREYAEEPEFVLSESTCIVEYLEEIAPQPPLLPPVSEPERRARLRFVTRLHDMYIAPKVQALFPHVDPRSRDLIHVRANMDTLRPRLAQLNLEAERYAEGPLGDAVFDAHAFSLVDCCLPVTLLLAERLADVLDQPPLLDGRLRRWLTAVATHPSLVDIVAEAQVATEEWLTRKTGGDDSQMEEGWWNVGRHRYEQAIGEPEDVSPEQLLEELMIEEGAAMIVQAAFRGRKLRAAAADAVRKHRRQEAEASTHSSRWNVSDPERYIALAGALLVVALASSAFWATRT